MKYFLFVLFFITALSKKFSLKIMNTPIYQSIPICLFHSIVLLENNDFDNENNVKNDVFVVDFSPLEDIGSPNIIFKIVQGQKIQGNIRVCVLPKELYKPISREPWVNKLYSKKTTIFESVDSQVTNENLKKLENIDPYLVFIIKSWGTSFQLYNRNCRHFSNFLQRHYF